MATISLKNISLTYDADGDDIHALSHISLEIASGESVALIGPSGCGKSTVLKLVSGLLAPSSGEVSIDGRRIERPRSKTGLILQDYGLLPWKTVFENAALGLTIAGVNREKAHTLTQQSLETVGLEDFAHYYPAQLSGGMKQRLAIARSLALDTDIMLMDEPLSALDALTREELQNVLLTLWRKRNYTQILVTHSIEEAVFLGQTIVVLTPGPGRIQTIINNPHAGADGFRDSDEFFTLSRRLREELKTRSTATAGISS